MSEEKQLSPMESFQEKIRGRLRDDFANLMPDDALSELVQKAAEDIFLKPERFNAGSASFPRYEDRPNFFMQVVETEIKGRAVEALQEWMRDNDEKIEKMMKDFLNRSAEDIVYKAITRQFEQPIAQMQYEVEQIRMKNNNDMY